MTGHGFLPLIDAGLRGGALSLLLLLALFILGAARRSPAALYGGLLCLSIAAYVVNSWPSLHALCGAWLVPAAVFSMGIPALFLLYARANFDDDFTASWRDGALWLATVALGCGCAFGPARLVCLVFQGVQLLWIALAIRLALAGRAADLVEERRRFRVVLVIAASSYSAAIIVLEVSLHGPAFDPLLSAATAAGLFLITFAIAAWELSLAAGRFAPAQPARRAAPAEPPEPSAEERALLARLRQVMEAEKAYREAGLAVAGLAARLEIPEYRLRRLINQRLGQRNFSSFVNGYRLAEARAALADPAQAEVPVVTIALDAGFQSLGPFNRAFKAETGMTPSDYRRRRLGASGNRPPASPISEIGKPFPG
ncbi:MAG TPA: helix-turn-helix domain-containing protein [Stellaceae bacterium]|nr:helix-turn-helix domain-containing protein [Stellaceae bacterium]